MCHAKLRSSSQSHIFSLDLSAESNISFGVLLKNENKRHPIQFNSKKFTVHHTCSLAFSL